MIILVIILIGLVLLLSDINKVYGYQAKPKYSKLNTSSYIGEIKSPAPKSFKIHINR